MKITELNKPAAPAFPGASATPEPPLAGGKSQPGLDDVASAPQEPQIDGQMTVEECIEEAQHVEERTPSGIEIHYEWAPRRLYRIRRASGTPDPEVYGPDWREVPSVTTVLKVLDRSGPLTWWGMKCGVSGMVELARRGEIELTANILRHHTADTAAGMTDEYVDLLSEHKLTCNHVMNKASDRGVNIHDALESWCRQGVLPIVEQYPEEEQGYITGLNCFLAAVQNSGEVDGMELMVGSLEHQYAGRFDLTLNLSQPTEVVTRAYPKRADKVEEIPAGRYLMDLKTRKKAAVYDTNYLQLEAYERASVECGYKPTDYRAIIVVTPDGKYQLSVNQDWCFEDFAQIRATYQVMNEREVLRTLREELGATEVATSQKRLDATTKPKGQHEAANRTPRSSST